MTNQNRKKKYPTHKKTAAKGKVKKAVDRKLASRKGAPKKRKPALKKAAVKTKALGKKKVIAKAQAAPKKRLRGRSQSLDREALDLQGMRSRSASQAGDLQGIPDVERADSESVNELLDEGNAFEADVVAGVENAGDSDEREVRTHEVPEDDVPGEYLDKD